MKKALALTAAGLMLAVFTILPAFPQQVNYEVRIQTGTIDKAGTDANIYLTIINEKSIGSQEFLLDNPGKNDFEKGNHDVFLLKSNRDLGPIKTISIRSDNKGNNPGWYLESVKVYYSPPNGKPDQRYPIDGNRNVTNFRYRGWVEGPNKLKVTLNCTDTIGAGGGGLGSTSSSNTLGIPAAPTNLSASPNSANSIRLNWNDGANNEQGFKIERSTSASGGFSQLATPGANSTSFDNTGLSPGTYYYRIRAYNASGNSAYSNTASAAIAGGPRDLKVINNITGSGGFVNILQLRVGNNVESTPSTEKLSPDNYQSPDPSAIGQSIAANGGTKTVSITSSNYSVFIGLGQWSWTTTSQATNSGYWSKKLWGVDGSNRMFWIFCKITINNHSSGTVTLTAQYDAGNNLVVKMGNQTFNFLQSFADPITVH